MISIIMPVYNAESFLEESIESILTQSYKNFELILINDGSKDNSLKIIREFEQNDSRIKVISRENKGLVKSLNEGIAIARGEYIARMDADDIANPERLEIQVNYMKRNMDIDLCGGRYSFLNHEERSCWLEKEFNALKEEKSEELIIKKGISISHGTFLFRRKIIDKVGDYDELRYAEDLGFQVKLLKFGLKLALLKERLLKVRFHENSKSTKEERENVYESISLRLEYILSKNYLREKKIIVWGASIAGEFTVDYLIQKLRKENIRCVDKYKKGGIRGIKIEKCENIQREDIVLVCTKPGKLEVQKYLEERGIKYYTLIT